MIMGACGVTEFDLCASAPLFCVSSLLSYSRHNPIMSHRLTLSHPIYDPLPHTPSSPPPCSTHQIFGHSLGRMEGWLRGADPGDELHTDHGGRAAGGYVEPIGADFNRQAIGQTAQCRARDRSVTIRGPTRCNIS